MTDMERTLLQSLTKSGSTGIFTPFHIRSYKETMTEFSSLNIGVLALQGDFERHLYQLRLEGVNGVEVKLPKHLYGLHGLIIPGGESTTMSLLLDRFALREPLKQFSVKKPVWGTCAGMIMLAKTIADNQSGVKPLGLLDIDVLRNGYGRQFFSFVQPLAVSLNGTQAVLHATFIRAPKIVRLGSGLTVLAQLNDVPVLVTHGTLMVSSFHTELDNDTTLLRFFLKNCLAV